MILRAILAGFNGGDTYVLFRGLLYVWYDTAEREIHTHSIELFQRLIYLCGAVHIFLPHVPAA